jgi:cytidine deaminase
MAEFCEPAFKIIVAKDPEHYELYTLEELLPKSFGPENLKTC